MIDEAMRTLFLATSAITTLVPAETVNGISISGVFTDSIPQGFLGDCILINVGKSDAMVCMDGTYGLQTDTLVVDCHAQTAPEAKAIAAAVKTLFDDYTGTVGGHVIKAVIRQNEQTQAPIDVMDARDVPDIVRTLVFTVMHQAA